MDRDRTSSDSSSWSLVDIEDDVSDSDVDVIENNLIVESVHDSDSEVDESENEEIDDESDVESIQETENEKYENLDENLSENEKKIVEIIQKIEPIEKFLQFSEQTKVVKTLDQLSKCAESPFEKFVKTVVQEANGRSLTFFMIVVATIFGVGLGHYIGACLIGNQPLPSDSLTFCLESEKTKFVNIFENSGLQYQNFLKSDDFENSQLVDPLFECKEKLFDAKAEIRMKQGVNRFVRENYKQKLVRVKQEFETRLALYKRASRKLFASNYVPKSKLETKMINKTNLTGQICFLAEKKIVNLTKSIFFSVSNWTRQPVFQNLVKLTPKIDQSLKNFYTWSAKNFNKVFDEVNVLAKMPKLNFAKKMKEFVRSNLKNYAKKAFSSATTALSQKNLSSMMAKYKPLIQNFGKQIKPTLTQFSKFSLSKFSTEVCFSTNPCESAKKFAKIISKNAEMIHQLGKNRVDEYANFLNSLTNKNCSKQLECEKFWWFGCQNEILKTCQLKNWQKTRKISGIELLNQKKQLKQAAVEIGWIQTKKALINCPIQQPILLPSLSMPMSPQQSKFKPCNFGSNFVKSFQSESSLSRPCKPINDVKSVDWLSKRAQTRAEQRSVHKKQAKKLRTPPRQKLRL